MNYKKDSVALLSREGINLTSNIEYNVNTKTYSFTIEEIIDAYMQASEDAQKVFYLTLKEAIENEAVNAFFEKMGQLLLMSSLSDNFIE